MFGRSASFDPQSDSCVRVQAKRLRLKLTEYYASEGANDPVVVSIPKGSYHLVFETKQPDSSPKVGTHAEEPRLQPSIPRLWRFVLMALLICLLLSLVLVGSLLWGHRQANASEGNPNEVSGHGPLIAVLAAIHRRERRTMGNLQQRCICWPPRDRHAVLQRA